MIRVAVFPCGSEIALEVHRSLSKEKNIELIGVSSIEDHGKFVYKNYVGDFPFVTDDNFLIFFKNLINEKKIDYIYPCMDIVMPILKQNEQYLNCKVITSPIDSVEICISKQKTYDFFKDILKTPKVFSLNDEITFPLFSKPSIGASSRGTFKINDMDDFIYITKKYPKNLILEYLPGEEYTIDCFTKSSGELIYISPRLRSRISNGISVNTKLIEDNLLNEMAHLINKNIKLNGSWFFQVKKDINNEYCLLEIATRFGGSSAIQRFKGINFPLMNLFNEEGKNVEIINHSFEIEIDRGLDIKGNIKLNFDKVYVDLDDTIIINDKVNTEIVSKLYDFLNEGKKLYLISKHKHNIYKTLKKYKINKKMFKKIIHLKPTDKKYKYMKKNSIFIDDSFSERKEVFDNLNIPTFSINNLNIL